MDRKLLAHLALLVVNLIYGANYPIAKSLMPGVIGPAGFILLRVIGAVLLFWSLRAVFPQKVEWKDAGRFLLCGLTGVAVNQLFFFEGLMRTTAVNASIIMVATPILVLVLSGLIIGERITQQKLGGVVLGAAGALTLILSHGSGGGEGASLKGDLFILINACSFAIYLVMVKPLMRKYSAITVMSWCFLLGSVIVVPFGAGEFAQVQWPSLQTTVLWKMAFVVVCVTFFAYLLNTWALRHVEPSVVGIYIYLQPMLAVLFTWLAVQLPGLGGNSAAPHVGFGWVQALSAALIFLGVYLVGRADAKERQ
ncbi:MAG: DMT family transporter [Flavobacteriales bacterium]